MIIGLGTDIVNIGRIEALLEKSGDKFKQQRFTPHEIEASGRYGAENKKAIAAHFAKRFAAKEAFAKAVGTGFGKHLSFLDIGVKNDVRGKPCLVLSDKAGELVTKIAQGNNFSCHVSLSDDYPYAVATVVIEG